MVDAKINSADLKKLHKKLNKLSRFAKQEAVKEINTAILEAHRLAVSAAPVAKRSDQGQGSYGSTLKQSIQPKALKDGAELFSTAHYAPYVEFGTGNRYLSPNDATKLGIPDSYIAQFKGKGIREVNLDPQPFFYSSVAKAYKKMLARLEKRLKRITNE